MLKERLWKVLAQQAADGLSRQEELILFSEALAFHAMALRKFPEDLFRQLEQDLHKRAIATLEWQHHKHRLTASDGDSGHFIITEQGEALRLDFGWLGYGAMGLGIGTQSQLMARAQKLLREGGPFGGPEPEEPATQPWYQWQKLRYFLRRGGISGELLINTASNRSPEDHELSVTYRDGTFGVITRGATRNVMSIGDRLAEDPDLRDRFPPVTARVGDLAVPWRHLNRTLFRGIIPTPTADLLLLSFPKGAYGIACNLGDANYLPIALRPIDLIQEFDVLPILAELIGADAVRSWLDLVGLVPSRSKPAKAREPEPVRAPDPPASLPGPSSVRPLSEASRDASVPAPTQRSAPSRPASSPDPSPPPIDGDTVVLQHFKSFLADIPAGQGGSATARAVIPGVADAYLRGSPNIEGTWKDIFGFFVDGGFLDDMPSDKTARAVLGILKASPVFQRLDTQQWRICLAECRDPKSEVFQALLREHLERTR